MRRCVVVAVVCLAWLIPLSAQAQATDTKEGYVSTISFMGGNWQNANRGGFLFQLTSMPSDVTYFIVRPDDIALENFAMVVTSAKLTGTSIVIGYSKENEGTDGRWEGKVYSIVLK